MERELQATSVAGDDLDEKTVVVGLTRAGGVSGGSRRWPDSKVANPPIEIALPCVNFMVYGKFKCAVGSP